MATAHSYFITASNASFAISTLGVSYDPKSFEHLRRCLRVFCLNTIMKETASLATSQTFTSTQYTQVEQTLHDEIALLVLQALNLIECHEFDDNSLCSTIGSFDGQDITRTFAAASANKLNDRDVLDGFKKHVMPIMERERQAREAKM